jgi:hypothetical protein
VTYHRDHIFPQSQLEATRLIDEYGMSQQRAEYIENISGKVANLQLLTSEDNLDKVDSEFQDWLTGLTDEYRERHLIPEDESLYTVDNFPSFVERREELIKEHITQTFGEFS